VHTFFLILCVQIDISVVQPNVQNPDRQEIEMRRNFFSHRFFFCLHQFIVAGLTQPRTWPKMGGNDISIALQCYTLFLVFNMDFACLKK
jgi:hypothetical protein